MIRPTIRLRLTLLFGALFFVTGIVLLVLTYVLLRQALNDAPIVPRRDLRGPIAEIVADIRRDDRAETLRQVINQATVALIVTSTGAMALGWVIANQVLEPVRRITDHARRASEATLSERVGLDGPPDELKELGDTFDAMLGRLQAAFESQQRFAAQASHELRTPLAILRAEADVALAERDATEREQRFATTVRDVAVRSERLIDSLLALAKSESTLRQHDPLDLAELTGDVVGELVDLANERGITIDLHLETAHVTGDRHLLERMIGNLVENAIRHNIPGGWVSVLVAMMRDHAILRITNSGPQIQPAAVSSLFVPFQRGPTGDERATGFGLGLAIVQAVLMTHAGTITAEPGPAGGLAVTIRLAVTGQRHVSQRFMYPTEDP